MAEPLRKLRGEIIYDEKGKDTGERESSDPLITRTFKQGVIGTAEGFATSLPGLYGLAGAGYEWLTTNKPFADAMLDPNGGKEGIEALDKTVINDIIKNNPGIDDKGLQEKFEEVTKHSKKYYDAATPFFRTGTAFTRNASRAISEYVGDPRLPTERTQYDNLVGIVGSAAIPIPGSAGAKAAALMARPAQTVAGKAGKVALNVAELTTPVTVPFTWTRAGANVAIGETADQAGRIAHGQPSVLTNDDGSADAGNLAIGGLGAIGTAIAAYKLRHKVPQTVRDTNDINFPNPNPIKQDIAHFGSDIGAPISYARSAGVEGDDLSRVVVGLESNLGPNAQMRAANAFELGILSDNSRIAPLQQSALRVQSNPQLAADVDQFVRVRSRLAEDIEAVNEVATETATKQAQLAGVRGTAAVRAQKRQDIQQQLNDLHLEANARRADSDPNLRAHMTDVPSTDAVQTLRRLQSNPEVVRAAKEIEEFKRAHMRLQVREGLMTPAQFAREDGLLQKGIMNLSDNPFTGRNLLQRVKMRSDDVLDPTAMYVGGNRPKDPFAMPDNYGLNLPKSFRKGYIGDKNETVTLPNQQGLRVAPRPNTPYDPYTQAAIYSQRTMQAISANRAKRDYAKMILAAPKNVGSKYAREVSRTPGHMIKSKAGEINKLLGSDSKTKAHIGYYDGGDYVVTQVNSQIVKQAFDYAPAAVVPVFSTMRKTTQAVLTGPLNPLFAAVSAPWDVMMASMFRNPKLVFGPVSEAAAHLFGRTSPITRAISTAATPIDMIAMLHILPFAMGAKVIKHAKFQMTARYGQAISHQLATNSGVFGTLAQLPGGRTILNKVGAVMAKSHHNSMEMAMRELRVGHSNILVETDNISKTIKSLEKGAASNVKAGFRIYTSMLSAIHDTAKELFLSQNLRVMKRELGRAPPQEMRDWLASETRKIGGDFQRVSGYRGVAKVMSTIPYGNVMLQSNRYMMERIKRNPAAVTSRIMFGSVLPMVYLWQNMSTWEGANDWFWNQLPADKRAGMMPFERPDIWYRRHILNENVAFKPEYIIPIRMAPEMMPLTIPLLHGLLSMGWFPNAIKGNQVPVDVARDMAATIDNVFGLGAPPIVSGIFAAGGNEIKPGAWLRGDSILRELRPNNVQGANKNMMSAGSTIPKAFYDTIQAMYGVQMANMLASANVAQETFGRTKSITEAASAGAETAALKYKGSAPMGGALFPEAQKKFIYTPASEELQKNMAILREVSAQAANEPGMSTSSTPGRPIRTGFDPNTAVGAPVNDPMLRAVINRVQRSLFSGGMLTLERMRRDLRAKT